MGVPVTLTFLLKTTAMSTVAPAPYVPPVEDTRSTLAGTSGLCGVVALTTMFFDPPSDLGDPGLGSPRSAGLPAASCMVPPLRDRASMPV